MTDRDSHATPELEDEQDRLLAASLRHAFMPVEIDAARHELVLRAALEDPFAPASMEEIAESERLREALDGVGEHRDVALMRALAAAYTPAEGRLAHRSAAGETEVVRLRVGTRPRRLGYGAIAAALAAAAAIVLLIGTRPRQSDPLGTVATPDLPALALARSRSTASMFRQGSRGEPSARIDLIATARSRELRDNRYAQWGVR